MSEPPAASRPRPKVVYVMGAGHSGSTILGVALGNCEGFFYAGEVEEWLVKSGQPSWADGQRREFWSTVSGAVEGADVYGSAAVRTIERSSSILRANRWRARRRLLPRYRAVSQELLQAIAGTAACEHVIDTSHFPLRARELGRLPGIELYVVFLVRDPEDVVASNLRELRPHELAERRVRTLSMNADLWLTLAVSVLVFLRHPRRRRLFVRHEQFVRDPEGVLREILAMVGSRASLPDLDALEIGAPIEGNRLIRTATIAVRRGTEGSHGGSPLTAALQSLWSPVLSRLRPAACGAR